jgi:hypothetical protein
LTKVTFSQQILPWGVFVSHFEYFMFSNHNPDTDETFETCWKKIGVILSPQLEV